MLRSNSKQARENVRNWIIEHAHFEEYCFQGKTLYDEIVRDMYWNPERVSFARIAKLLDKTFYDEKVRLDKRWIAGRISHQQLFTEWCQGLPTVLDTASYYYHCNAKEYVQQILDETAEDADRHSEEAAEEMLTYLIYREIASAIDWRK